jgi:hypothetical protein
LVLEQEKVQMGHFRQNLNLCLVHCKQGLQVVEFCCLQAPYRSSFVFLAKRVLGYFLALPILCLFDELVPYFF